MDFFYRKTPAYKGTQPQPQAQNGLLSGLFGNLLSRGTPSYKNRDDVRAQASTATPGWWQVFVTPPSYKTAADTTDCSDASSTLDASPDTETADDCGCEANQVVIL
jgi:hypothetical protein